MFLSLIMLCGLVIINKKINFRHQQQEALAAQFDFISFCPDLFGSCNWQLLFSFKQPKHALELKLSNFKKIKLQAFRLPAWPQQSTYSLSVWPGWPSFFTNTKFISVRKNLSYFFVFCKSTFLAYSAWSLPMSEFLGAHGIFSAHYLLSAC